MGEPSKLIVLKSVLKEIKKENLLQLVQETGEVLLSGLRELEVGPTVRMVCSISRVETVSWVAA